ncbi:hypothetical protein GCM10023084_77350 [Streptomyces lacrimifluminis]|uniref:Uncharacterized protein n=1 Tax=Streptomyces lacrimifluminis TaxID=1500077 RepID=A0A917UMA0_9ACTN|nr:hypothetical protein [Streptomyces lacrimifluminis]GGJ67879.1 hypothetical protein GCM10012282_76120 [Streptomyces lacrimifluminis]
MLMRMGDTRLAMGEREAARPDWIRALDDAERQSLLHTAQQVRDRLAALQADEPHGARHGCASALAFPPASKNASP